MPLRGLTLETSTFRGLLFYRLLQQAVNLEPVRGKDLIGGKSLGNTTDSP